MAEQEKEEVIRGIFTGEGTYLDVPCAYSCSIGTSDLTVLVSLENRGDQAAVLAPTTSGRGGR